MALSENSPNRRKPVDVVISEDDLQAHQNVAAATEGVSVVVPEKQAYGTGTPLLEGDVRINICHSDQVKDLSAYWSEVNKKKS